MVVGEPSMMGGEYGEEDERTISRVENTQFDPNALHNQIPSMNQPMSAASMPLGGPAPQGDFSFINLLNGIPLLVFNSMLLNFLC